MNRKELVAAVADSAELEQKTVDAVLRGLQSVLEGAAAKGEKVSVPGVFALSVQPQARKVTKSAEGLGFRPLFDASAPVLPGLERLPSFQF